MPEILRLERTSSKDQSFINLVKQLDADLVIRDGEDHAFYAQFNKIDSIKYVIVAFENDIPIGCGAIKKYDIRAEIKRMYVHIDFRGKGYASEILIELERWASELGFTSCILETGVKQPEAIALYTKNKYNIISNYGPYIGLIDSKCFEKTI